ncbi:MAG: hypothetical protein ACLQGT_12020 [Terracidiphilus sp.]
MNLKTRIALLALLLAPSLGFGQTLTESIAKSLTVHSPFDSATYKPLSGHERWERWVDEDGRSASIHVESLGTAFYNQTFDVPAAWTRSGGGLARRLGSAYGENLIQNTMHESFAAAEGTDPRYFPCACKGLFRRGGHVIKMSFLTYNRGGHLTLDLPQITSIYGSSMIQAMWYPSHYTALAQGVQSGHIEAGFIGTEHMVQEFAPELERFFHLRFLMHPATQ